MTDFPSSPVTARDELIKRLVGRADAHDKMCFGSPMGLGYFSGNDARLLRDAADLLRGVARPQRCELLDALDWLESSAAIKVEGFIPPEVTQHNQTAAAHAEKLRLFLFTLPAGCGDPGCKDPDCDYGKYDDALHAEVRQFRIDNARLRDEAFLPTAGVALTDTSTTREGK